MNEGGVPNKGPTARRWWNSSEFPLKKADCFVISVLWGEPTFDQTESFMIYIRFNTSEDPAGMSSGIMYSTGTLETAFATPIVLN